MPRSKSDRVKTIRERTDVLRKPSEWHPTIMPHTWFVIKAYDSPYDSPLHAPIVAVKAASGMLERIW